MTCAVKISMVVMETKYIDFLFAVVTGGNVYVLDLAAKIDQCAEYLCKAQWGELEFPPPFGRDALPEVLRESS